MSKSELTNIANLTGTKFEILVSCTGLADLDEFTKSDPMCVLFFKHFGQWREIGRTEAIRNTLDPKFVVSYVLEFDPTVQQCLMFSLYDIDSRSTDLRHHDFVGSVEVTFDELVDSDKNINTCCKTLRVTRSSRGRGIISITAERVHECNDKVSLHVGAHKLAKKGKILTTKPDVYLEISRCINNVSFHPVYRTETVSKTQNPRWRPLELDLQRVCNGDWDRLLELSVWHHSGSGDYKMIGRKVTTLRELKNMHLDGHYKEVTLAPRKHEKESKLKNSIKITSCGTLRFFHVRVDCDYSLLDYTRGGMQINLVAAIDFTSSNGKTGESMSLHDISDRKKTPYMEVLDSLGGLICQYCSEQRIGLVGFGAKTNNSSVTSHCFPLSNDWNKLYYNGIQNSLSAYKSSVKKVLFSGPTRLKPVISLAESLSVKEPTQDRQVYTILLVITDGIINDIDDVIERLISISHLPLSVVFVGVGPAEFSLMECFSHNNIAMLSSKELNICTSRRNTHFVAFPSENGQCINTSSLARDTFAIISSQVTEYMRHKDIIPNRPQLSTLTSSSSIIHSGSDRPGTLRRSNSRASLTSLISKKSTTIGPIGAKCPTCGSILQSETTTSTLVASASVNGTTLTGIG